MAKLTDKAHPTTRGWVHSRTGELLKSQHMTEAQVASWWAEKVGPVEHAVPQMLNEAPSVERNLTPSEHDHHYLNLGDHSLGAEFIETFRQEEE
tara:strand:- start:42 stop:323 length:282 start_codon:yes stop_codon:yes gene_type:complete